MQKRRIVVIIDMAAILPPVLGEKAGEQGRKLLLDIKHI